MRSTLSQEELTRLFAAAKSPTDRLILEMMYFTGMRVSELCSLPWTRVDFDRKVIRVLGKGRKERISAPSEDLFLRLKVRRARASSEFVFPGRFSGHITKEAIEKMMRGCVRRAGLSAEYTPHCLRHTFATNLIRHHGVSLEVVRVLMGHTWLTTTQIYLHPNLSDLREVSGLLERGRYAVASSSIDRARRNGERCAQAAQLCDFRAESISGRRGNASEACNVW